MPVIGNFVPVSLHNTLSYDGISIFQKKEKKQQHRTLPRSRDKVSLMLHSRGRGRQKTEMPVFRAGTFALKDRELLGQASVG